MVQVHHGRRCRGTRSGRASIPAAGLRPRRLIGAAGRPRAHRSTPTLRA